MVEPQDGSIIPTNAGERVKLGVSSEYFQFLNHHLFYSSILSTAPVIFSYEFTLLIDVIVALYFPLSVSLPSNF